MLLVPYYPLHRSERTPAWLQASGPRVRDGQPGLDGGRGHLLEEIRQQPRDPCRSQGIQHHRYVPPPPPSFLKSLADGVGRVERSIRVPVGAVRLVLPRAKERLGAQTVLHDRLLGNPGQHHRRAQPRPETFTLQTGGQFFPPPPLDDGLKGKSRRSTLRPGIS